MVIPGRSTVIYFYFLIMLTPFLTIKPQEKIAHAVRVKSGPVIDGYLNDDVWKQAIPITDFTQQEPIAGAKPSLQTEVRIIYDDENLYVGVMCYDNEPDKIIARALKWDGFISADDNVKLIFDTFDDDRTAYWFGTNPLGSHNDALLTGFEMKDLNDDWNGIWDVACRILDNGWSAEFVFPFSTFKFYDKEKQTWGFNFLRDIRRKNEEVLWTSIGQNLGLLKIAEAGDLIGIENIKRGNPMYLKPYLTAGAQFTNGDKSFVHEPGFDVKYGITETLSLDATINTDFAQVESDRARINLSRFPLFFPEKRDFFLEGMKLFDFNFGDNNSLFYSRKIGLSNGERIPIIAGAKLVGRLGNFEIGAINMQTASKGSEPTTNYSTARVKYDLFGSSSVGFLLTNKVSDAEYNRAFGTDLHFSFNDFLGDKNLIIHAAVAKSDQKDGAKNSWAGKFFVDYPNDLIDQYVGYNFIQSNFNPEMGFIRRRGYQQFIYNLDVTPRVNWNGIKKILFEAVQSSLYYDKDGILQSAVIATSPLGFLLDSGDDFGFTIMRLFDKPNEDFGIFDSTVIIKAGSYWYTNYGFYAESSPARIVYGSIQFNGGNFYNGTSKTLSLSGTLTVNKNLDLEGDYLFNNIHLGDKSFNTNEVGGRINYYFSTRVASSIFAQWNNEQNEININYRVNWKPKIGSDFYLVINHLLSTAEKIRSKDFAILAKFVWMITI